MDIKNKSFIKVKYFFYEVITNIFHNFSHGFTEKWNIFCIWTKKMWRNPSSHFFEIVQSGELVEHGCLRLHVLLSLKWEFINTVSSTPVVHECKACFTFHKLKHVFNYNFYYNMPKWCKNDIYKTNLIAINIFRFSSIWLYTYLWSKF